MPVAFWKQLGLNPRLDPSLGISEATMIDYIEKVEELTSYIPQDEEETNIDRAIAIAAIPPGHTTPCWYVCQKTMR